MKKFWNEARLSNKIIGGLLALVIIGWSATAIYANTITGNTVVEPEESQASDMASELNLITDEEAIEIAREHLISIGITNATLTYSYSDIENGIAVWSIEFRYNGRDLEFYVAKETGNFLKYPVATTNNSDNTSSMPAPASAETISRKQAGEIALAVTPGRLVEVSHDRERGRTAWWVEIRYEGMVHEFYIDMETGAILQHEIEKDD